MLNNLYNKEKSNGVVSPQFQEGGLKRSKKIRKSIEKSEKPSPWRHAIRDLENNFQRSGSIADKDSSGRISTASGAVQDIEDAITRCFN